jgi:CRP-like cAMP-binding protein
MLLNYEIRSEHFFPLFAGDLFCDLTPASLEALTHIKQTKQLQKGVSFFVAGDTPRYVYLLVKGEAQLFFNDKKGIDIARLIEPNEILGLIEMILNLPYETDARTITPCIYENIGREDLIRFLHGEPEVCFRLVQLLSLNLQKSCQPFGLQ